MHYTMNDSSYLLLLSGQGVLIAEVKDHVLERPGLRWPEQRRFQLTNSMDLSPQAQVLMHDGLKIYGHNTIATIFSRSRELKY